MKNKALFIGIFLCTAIMLVGCADLSSENSEYIEGQASASEESSLVDDKDGQAELEAELEAEFETELETELDSDNLVAVSEETETAALSPSAENELTMLPGEVAESYVYIDYASDDFSGADVFFISENEKVASAAFDYVWDNSIIYYKVTAAGVGETYICAVLPSGEMLTPKCRVTVTGGDEPETEAPLETIPPTEENTSGETEELSFEKTETEASAVDDTADTVETAENSEQRLIYDDETVYELPPQPVPEVEVTGMNDECEVK